LDEDPDRVGDVVRTDSAMPTGPCKGGNFRPGWQAFCFYPFTVYVTARRPRKRLPVAALPSRGVLLPIVRYFAGVS